MTTHRTLGALLLLTSLTLAACSSTQAPAPETTSKTPAAAPAATDAVRIAGKPDQIPAAITRKAPETVKLSLTTKELNGTLSDGTTYTYWTFDGQVPGPMLRVRQGDTVELTLTNDAKSQNVHSIDLHAVTGPGGGAGGTQVKPGESKKIMFQAMNAGVYVYHCASPHIPTHIAKGMYGLIVVEPQEGLKKVDREFYLMQGEVYAAGPKSQKGHKDHDGELQSSESPNWVVFNGQAASLTGDNAMKAKVGETVRLFVGNGGPNLISSFHVIGEIFDEVHQEGAREAVHDIQTTLIPAGGATWVEFKVDVPGRYLLVDHSITRAIDKGAVAYLEVEGADNPAVFHAAEANMSGH
ncbi:MAG TPA: copper-containing nitrite reductase [Symbiobacteriaceae bacterium]|nr:copper-containing nitrite reductase [Symbiobacteriaceae bacterium]